MTPRFQSILAGVGSLLAVAGLLGCTAVASPAAESSTVGTVSGVGELPLGTYAATEVASIETATPNTVPATDPGTTTTTIPLAQTIGAKSAGNRVLMIGDSITASISQRYGKEACQALVPLGWRLEVDAEVGRFIDFGKIVLDKRLSAGWDAAVIFLGTNYGDKQDVYQAALHAMLLRLVPLPTVLINTTVFRPEQQQVNDAIAAEAALFTSVTVIDWATITQDPSLTGGDNIHLTDAGRRMLAYQLAGTMGSAPTQPGACLKTNYTNDSAGSPYGPAGNATIPKTTVANRPTTPTTAKATATTAAGSGTTASTTANTTATTKPTGSTTATTPAPLPTPLPTIPVVVTTAAPPTTPAPATTAAPPVTKPPDPTTP